MNTIDRRTFLGSSLGGLAAAMALHPSALLAEDGLAIAAERPGPRSLFLTWQRDPTRSMTIQWIGPDSTCDTAIRVAPLGTDEWRTIETRRKPFPNTDRNVFRCELTGLDPGTEYQFQIGSAPARFRFRTMPAKATDTIQFVSGGDSGIDVHAVGTNILAARQEPYFALLGGDLAYDNGTAPDVFVRFLENYSRHMIDSHGRLIPMLSCIGNHEVKGGYDKPRSAAPQYLSVFDGLFHDTTYGVLDFGDYMSLVLLDTGHVAPIGGEQTDWLRQVLADRQDRQHLIVANHVPAYPSVREFDATGTGTGSGNRKFWSPLFEKYNVDVVLEHHDHVFKRTHPIKDGLVDRHGVLYLGDGSWGRVRTRKKPDERSYLAACCESYHVTVHRLEGDQRFHVALEQSGKVADVCITSGKRPSRRA